MPSDSSLGGETLQNDVVKDLAARTDAMTMEAPGLFKQPSGNFIEDEGGIWGFGVDGAKCGCSEDAKAGCGDAAAEGEKCCGSGGDGGGEAPVLSRQRSGNFIEDEGGLWGIGVKCGCGEPSQGGDGGGGGACGNSCGTCTEGSGKPQACSKSHHVALHPVNPAAGMAPLALSEDGDRGKVFFASESGTTKRLAEKLLQKLKEKSLPFDLVDPASYEPEDLPKEKLVIVIASTWEDGKAPKNAAFLAQWLEESSEDFRVGSGILTQCRFGVFGVGSQAYGSNFNAVARAFDTYLASLGGVRMVLRGEGDVDEGTVEQEFDVWTKGLLEKLEGARLQSSAAELPEENEVDENTKLNGYESATLEVEEESDSDNDSETFEDANDGNFSDGVVDLEDMGGNRNSAEPLEAGQKRGVVRRQPLKKQVQGAPLVKEVKDGPKEMVTPVLRASLEKQGYKILGSHSGVKLCRWTKSQLRGRGGCYKHSFYGIESHRCMETTPSLACANKCVFCWRHHTNPVGKSWRWQMDDPIEIVNGALEQHTKMIKQMKGVPGVKPERLAEGMNPRHCALSLVGEPIMYPEINTLVKELHNRRISTFLVTNAQFPERITNLEPITQLYVSVDAATKEKLKAIDRPLFSDFWERFIDSLKAIKDKGQRTVYRLTLVKGWNTEEVKAYAELLDLGQPDFIEIKGVTYCGSTATSSLTMENVPWHEDVKAFAEAIAAERGGAEYELACEHSHSCCVLLAKTSKFKVNGKWHTWIDYEKFQDLVASGKPFGSEDYMALTPSWSVYGATEGGFDPNETRVKKERRHGSADPGGCT
ncbi:hypothetical protein M758_3G141600 [Ceratodon purpureus]|nr:hypothetical protein M758_3G141600 [Ceratodon purpureus]